MNSSDASTPRLAVAGSLNIDHFAMVEHLPAPGETVTAHDCFTRFGGKGANQAVAAARLGAGVSMLGMLGNDDAGQRYRQHLANENLNLTGLGRGEGPSGSATIAVEDGGENMIIVHPGANAFFKPSHLGAHRQLISGAAGLLLQLEIPLESVLAAARMARDAGVPVLLNPSPFRPDFPWGEVPLHTVIANRSEAQQLLGTAATPAANLREVLADRGIERLVVTRGAESTLAFHGGDCLEVRTFDVDPVDTVGAGDAFAGGLAVALMDAQPLEEALAFANAAGALATQQAGAQEAMPTRRDLLTFLKNPQRLRP